MEKNKKKLFIAPHPDDDVIGCGALLLSYERSNKTNITIAYAVSGFNGIGDKEKSRDLKSQIRRNEALACCEFLGAQPAFWNLPFYEQRRRNFGDIDLDIIRKSIKDVMPDVIFLIDEESDPNGTHGAVKNAVMSVLKSISFSGALFGYRVWDEPYDRESCDLLVSFDEELMEKKEQLIRFHESQMQDPAFPCDHKDFVELVKIYNVKVAKEHNSDLPYAECYRKIKLF